MLAIVLSDMQDRLEMFSTEEDLENASLYEPLGYVGVVFLDNMSYRLRFPYNQLPLPSDYTESIGKAYKGINISCCYYYLETYMRSYVPCIFPLFHSKLLCQLFELPCS